MIIIIEIKIEDTVLFKPFRWNENVRFSCDIIVIFIKKIDIDMRLLEGQKDNWIIMISMRLMHRNIGDGITELNDAGSNEEKMSLIMQNMEDPFRTLKVLSLY